MPILGVIDDRDDLRETIVKTMALVTDESWTVLSHRPLPHLSDYGEFLTNESITVLIVDEKLSESGDEAVTYSGHEVASWVRKNLHPDFPIWMLTSYASDEEVLEHEADVEGVVERDPFSKEPEKYIGRFQRSGQRYLEVHEKRLAAINALCEHAASNGLSKEDEETLRTLQRGLHLQPPPIELLSRSSTISALESALDRAADVQKKLSALLSKKA